VERKVSRIAPDENGSDGSWLVLSRTSPALSITLLRIEAGA
jgi:hypothetical protein